jgi:hypothetical protein
MIVDCWADFGFSLLLFEEEQHCLLYFILITRDCLSAIAVVEFDK